LIFRQLIFGFQPMLLIVTVFTAALYIQIIRGRGDILIGRFLVGVGQFACGLLFHSGKLLAQGVPPASSLNAYEKLIPQHVVIASRKAQTEKVAGNTNFADASPVFAPINREACD